MIRLMHQRSLLHKSISCIPQNQFPQISSIFQYFNYRRSLFPRKRMKNRIVLGCAQTHGNRTLTCDNPEKGCAESPYGRCVVYSVMKPWINAGFEDLVLTPLSVRKKLEKLLLEFKLLKRNSNPKPFIEFQDEAESKLFDITLKNVNELIRSDKSLDKEAIQETIQFLHDQRTTRVLFIGSDYKKCKTMPMTSNHE